MVADGVLPANIGREYVLRRLLRRTFLHANLLGIQLEEIVNLAMTVVTMFAQFYPELERNRETIKYVISAESDNFEQTMRRGRRELEKVLSHSPSIIKGEDAFRLQDTYGFPFGLTSEVAKERGLQLDEEGFKVCLEEQRKRSRLKRGCKS